MRLANDAATIRAAAAGISGLLVLLLAGCAGTPEPVPDDRRTTAAPAESPPSETPPSESPTAGVHPPEPGFPGLGCDTLIDPEAAGGLLGARVAAPPTHLPDPVIVQDNGIECTWASASVVDGFAVHRDAPAVVLRATPHGPAYWPAYVSGSGHNQWDDTLGDASGVVCEPGVPVACTLSVLSGEVFFEISAFGIESAPEQAIAALRELGAAVLPQLAGSATPVDPTRPQVRHRTERCWALLGRTDDAAGPSGADVAPDRVPGRSMTNTAVDLTGSTVCDLDFGDDDRIQVLVVPDGGWMQPADDAMIGGSASAERNGALRVHFDDGSSMDTLVVRGDLVQVRWRGAAESERARTLVDGLLARLG
ncbi:hypothetical protein ACFPER_04735 [Agromyces aurantiacus]|uniref:DUF3558 domain-containing protein n=1 Tax=Agromyces aurantiacus TaxID=165814 RepID=A0ABV9R1U1_9MICO|nr:hypothetical protein [Agromyces aurantiacus]MBM7502764.1 hypothetical protein [Agromyces aurantiacus]